VKGISPWLDRAHVEKSHREGFDEDNGLKQVCRKRASKPNKQAISIEGSERNQDISKGNTKQSLQPCFHNKQAFQLRKQFNRRKGIEIEFVRKLKKPITSVSQNCVWGS
jgi:hypothetical protein